MQDANEDLRVIAVGDDDQNIFEFRKSSSEYMKCLLKEESACKYNLLENYRSSKELVEFANDFAPSLPDRMKIEPLQSMNPLSGSIRMINHRSKNLVVPLIEDLRQNRPPGSICILTPTNDLAWQASSLLKKHCIGNKLIQSNERFNLLNLLEIRYFVDAIEDTGSEFVILPKLWEEAKTSALQKFAGSDNLPILQRLIEDFANTNPTRKFKSDLIAFVRESKLEDFQSIDHETILVSTIHKAKGKEFDNVYLLLENFGLTTGDAKRQLYVAITRAKTGLIIHHNNPQFDEILNTRFASMLDTAEYQPPDELVIELGYKDVYLDFFFRCHRQIATLYTGTELTINEKGCANSTGEPCLAFSKTGKNRLNKMKDQGYQTVKATVNFIVYWKKANEPEVAEIKIILPLLYFKRQNILVE